MLYSITGRLRLCAEAGSSGCFDLIDWVRISELLSKPFCTRLLASYHRWLFVRSDERGEREACKDDDAFQHYY